MREFRDEHSQSMVEAQKLLNNRRKWKCKCGAKNVSSTCRGCGKYQRVKKTKWKENEKIEFYCGKTKKWSKGRVGPFDQNFVSKFVVFFFKIMKARVFTKKG